MKYIIANWKMKMSLSDIKKWYSEFKKFDLSPYSTKTTIILAPTFVHIPIVSEIFNGPDQQTKVYVASQDCAEFEQGAYTGYVGAFQIKDFCKYAIVGHSERKEQMKTVMKKRDICLQNNLTPIVCFTEPELVIKYHTPNSLLVWEDPDNISRNGQYRPKGPKEIYEQSKKIKETLPSGSCLIYGGSVNRQNVDDLAKIYELDGVLVGNASLDPSHFFDIVQRFS